MKHSCDYRPEPFWFLNHKLEKPELLRQLDLMQQSGIKGFYMHPRAGLEIPYGSSDWFNLLQFIIEEADKRGLYAQLYDEDPFPSGHMGGKLILDNPDFRARELAFIDVVVGKDGQVNQPIDEGYLLEAVMVLPDGKVIDIADRIGMIRSEYHRIWQDSAYYAQAIGNIPFWHHRAETYHPHRQLAGSFPPGAQITVTIAQLAQTTDKYGIWADNLNPDCVSEFIRQTHDEYTARFSSYFGKNITRIFNDEAKPGGFIPWTKKLPETYRQLHGETLPGTYHKMAHPGSEGREIRRKYWETVGFLFENSFFRPLSAWCKKHQLELVGHCICEEDPLVMTNVYHLQQYFDLPGFDHVTKVIPDGSFSSLNLGGKLISSAANQQGKKQVTSECLACNAFNFNLAHAKKIVNWLYLLGVNSLIPHGFYYSYDGYRKDDAGKSFFFQDPDFSEFPAFAQYAANAGKMLGESRALNSICLLLPNSLFHSLYPSEEKEAEAIRDRIYGQVEYLLAHRIQFDLTDEATLLEADIHQDGFSIGRQTYQILLTPNHNDLFTEKSRAGMERLKKAGFPVFDDPAKLPREKIELEALPENRAPLSMQWMALRENERGVFLYLFNNSPEPGAFQLRGDFHHLVSRHSKTAADTTLVRYDASSDQRMLQDKNIFTVAPYASCFLELYQTRPNYPTEPFVLPPSHAGYPDDLDAEWNYTPSIENLAASLHCFDYTIAGKLYPQVKPSLLRELFGTELRSRECRPGTDQAPIRSAYPVQASARAVFTLSSGDKLQLLYESAGIVGSPEILLNGHPVPPGVRQTVYDAWNLVSDITPLIHSGENTLEFRWQAADEHAGLRSSIHILKQ